MIQILVFIAAFIGAWVVVDMIRRGIKKFMEWIDD
jgi:hypothetical protein